MRPMTASQLADAMGGVLHGTTPAPIQAVFTDTRNPVVGGAFFALAGPNHDAHDFLDTAVAAGAALLVVSRVDTVPPRVAHVQVEDTLEALTRLAAHVRRAHPGRFIAVTGSVGKTTVKDMLQTALGAYGRVGATPGNWNNHIGLPLTLCGLDGDEDFVILELGMSAPGEIAHLTALADPDVGLVTRATAAHLEFFDSVDAIADAKAELYATMRVDSHAVVNGDDARLLERAERLHPKGMMVYGSAPGADVQVTTVAQDRQGITADLQWDGAVHTFQIPVVGRHNATNLAAVITCLRALGLTPGPAGDALRTGLELSRHRLHVVATQDGFTILDDCYNANPASMHAALETFGEVAREATSRGAVLGSMLELGQTAPALHEAVGTAAGAVGVVWLGAVGPFAEDMARGARQAGVAEVRTASDCVALTDALRRFAQPGRWLLLKGSRSNRLERLLPILGAQGAGGLA